MGTKTKRTIRKGVRLVYRFSKALVSKFGRRERVHTKMAASSTCRENKAGKGCRAKLRSWTKRTNEISRDDDDDANRANVGEGRRGRVRDSLLFLSLSVSAVRVGN